MTETASSTEKEVPGRLQAVLVVTSIAGNNEKAKRLKSISSHLMDILRENLCNTLTYIHT